MWTGRVAEMGGDDKIQSKKKSGKRDLEDAL